MISRTFGLVILSVCVLLICGCGDSKDELALPRDSSDSMNVRSSELSQNSYASPTPSDNSDTQPVSGRNNHIVGSTYAQAPAPNYAQAIIKVINENNVHSRNRNSNDIVSINNYINNMSVCIVMVMEKLPPDFQGAFNNYLNAWQDYILAIQYYPQQQMMKQMQQQMQQQMNEQATYGFYNYNDYGYNDYNPFWVSTPGYNEVCDPETARRKIDAAWMEVIKVAQRYGVTIT